MLKTAGHLYTGGSTHESPSKHPSLHGPQPQPCHRPPRAHPSPAVCVALGGAPVSSHFPASPSLRGPRARAFSMVAAVMWLAVCAQGHAVTQAQRAGF